MISCKTYNVDLVINYLLIKLHTRTLPKLKSDSFFKANNIFSNCRRILLIFYLNCLYVDRQ